LSNDGEHIGFPETNLLIVEVDTPVSREHCRMVHGGLGRNILDNAARTVSESDWFSM
jgi:hypothetical protein